MVRFIPLHALFSFRKSIKVSDRSQVIVLVSIIAVLYAMYISDRRSTRALYRWARSLPVPICEVVSRHIGMLS